MGLNYPTRGVASPLIRSNWAADVCLLTTTLIWGVNIPVFKYAVRQCDPWLFNAVRLVLAAIALGVLVLVERAHRRQLNSDVNGFVSSAIRSRIPWGRLLLFALLSNILYQGVFVLGIFRTTSGNTALLMASMPMWTAGLSFYFLRERLRPIVWSGLFMTFVGTIVVTFSRDRVSLSENYLNGNLLVLTAALIWALATILSRGLMTHFTALQLAFWSSLLGLPFHILFAATKWAGLTALLSSQAVFGSCLFSGVMSTGVAYAFWNYGVRQLGGSHASVYQNVVTLVAVLGGWVFLQETVAMTQVVGGLLMCGGMFAMHKGRS